LRPPLSQIPGSAPVKSAVIVSTCPVTDISATVTPIDVKICTMVRVSWMCVLPFLRAIPQGSPKSKYFGHL